jgi:hypothetical protein
LADLPAPGAPPDRSPRPETVGTATAGALSSVFGDVRMAVTTAVPELVGTVFGDVQLDLRGLRTSADTVHLQLNTVFGDIEVIVGEGMTAEMSGFTVFGDRRTELAPVPRLAGTPHVVVRGRTVFGDLRLRSLPPGASPSRWRAVLDRLADRRPPSPGS